LVEGDYVWTDRRSFDIFSWNGLNHVISVIGCPLLVIGLITLFSFGLYFGYYSYVKPYLDKFVSIEQLVNTCCDVLKEQAIASNAQADAVSSQEGDDIPPVMSSFLSVDELRSQVLGQFSADESNLVVRFRMYMALRRLNKNHFIRCGQSNVQGKMIKTLKWTGSLDS